MKMTLDEAIQHCEDIIACDECREEHLQLAGWLKELKELRITKTGKWIIPNNACNVFDIYECSACNKRTTLGNSYKYCPNCGAKMEEK